MALTVLLPAGLVLLGVEYPLQLAVLLGSLVLIWVVFTRAEAMLLIFVAVLPWEGYLDFPTENLTLVKLLGLMLLVSYVIRSLIVDEELVAAPALIPVALLGLSLLLSLLLSPDPRGGLLDTTRYLLYIVFFFLIVQLARERVSVVAIIRVFALSAAGAAAVGVVGVLSGVHERATGPIKDPNDFAYLLSTVIPLAAYLAWRSARSRWLWVLVALLTLGGVLTTLSRGALVGLSVLLVWAVLRQKLPIASMLGFLVAAAVMVLIAFAAFGGSLSSSLEHKSHIASKNVDSRAAFWVAALKMTADHPLTGIGAGRLPEELPAYVRNDPVKLDEGQGHILRVHNSYLEILTEEGPLALLGFLAFLLLSWVGLGGVGTRAEHAGDEDGVRLAAALRGALIVAIVGACFISIQTGIPFWLLGGLAAALSSQRRPEGAPLDAKPRTRPSAHRPSTPTTGRQLGPAIP